MQTRLFTVVTEKEGDTYTFTCLTKETQLSYIPTFLEQRCPAVRGGILVFRTKETWTRIEGDGIVRVHLDVKESSSQNISDWKAVVASLLTQGWTQKFQLSRSAQELKKLA